MTSRVHVGCSLVAALGLLAAPPSVHQAAAQAPPVAAAVKKASKHFQRGVALYNETDYRAALVEFRRAYEVAPNPAVLYNIGQTHYQLQNYAQALTTFERYLAEAGADAPHADEVEKTVDLLRSRVGNVEITTNLPGCEINVDDELAGKTPLGQPVLVSIGRRKIVAMCEGQPGETRVVEVAAGDLIKVNIVIAQQPQPMPAPAINVVRAPEPPRDTTATWRKVGWTATAVLGAATVTTGVLALFASQDLEDERDTYPASASALTDKADKLRALSLTTDILGAATLIAGGVTLALTLTRPRARKEVRVGLAPRGLQLSGTFE
jgi:tetratricopeptide (TPR) repeat protein